MNNMRWDLTPLYESADSPKIQDDIKSLEKKLNEFSEYMNKNLSEKINPATIINFYLKMQEEFELKFTRLGAFAHLTVSTDAKNNKALSLIDQIQKLGTKLTIPEVKFQKWIASLENLESIISSDTFLQKHKFILNELVNDNKYVLSEDAEQIISKLKQTGSNAWNKLYNTLSATQMVEIEKDGKTESIPLPIIRNMAYEKDSKLRKNAYEAELKSYKNIEESLAAALNSIKGEVIEISNLRGFKSPLEQSLYSSRLDQSSLQAMLEAIEESLPSFRNYLKQKSKNLGNTGSLPFYDLMAPQGESSLKFTYDETRKFIVSNFSSFSQELADFASNAFENNWIDAEPREGKRGGGFCAGIKCIGESRILTNFTGVFSDVGTLAHELGHAFHSACLKNESVLNCHYTMPIAETASIFCESIVNDAFLKKSNNEERKSILASNLDDAIQCIVDIYSRYQFESAIFDKRQNSSLSVDEIKTCMIDAQKKAYGDGLDHNTLHPYMWACKPHYYSASNNFYNFPYAFGLLFAKGLYSIYLQEGSSFVKKYKELLSITGKHKISDVTKSVGIDITTKEFWKSSLKLIENDIKTFSEL